MTPVSIAAYLALFTGVGIAFLFANLLVGRFLRPDDPHAEKLEVYECGEPTIGSSFVQFDLRFYVVALLFIIFDVEIAFFFPWANVFGKSTQLMDPNFADAVVARAEAQIDRPRPQWTDEDRAQVQTTAERLMTAKFSELGVTQPAMDRILQQPSADVRQNARAIQGLAGTLARMSIFDIGVFFAVLMVGFFYVWRRGDLDWVRAVSRERAGPSERGPPSLVSEEAPALSA
jgi:NADH-quinone oxidoreductase subunit A